VKRARHSGYPMSLEESEELAHELDEFGYRETDDPDEADRRRFYKVEKWDAAEMHVEALLYASNDLSKARSPTCIISPSPTVPSSRPSRGPS
jgi:hypothetical protein